MEKGRGGEPGPLFRPQEGPQSDFLATRANIAIYGGAAGGGKTWALLLEPLRHRDEPDFSAVFFRRTTVQVRNPGGLWDESFKLYPGAGGEPFAATLEWRFGSGARVRFAHLEHEKTVLEWQGAQVPLICFDELTHFTAAQFWSMSARNRSVGWVSPYIRATCNPDADSWVAELIAWWVDPDTGLPIRKRAGKIRWFVRVGDRLEWAATKKALSRQYPELRPRSLTFVPALLKDNLALTKADPEYRARLLALPRVERERLLNGNWKIRPAAGLLFNRSWCQTVDAVPAGLAVKRGWDLAATPKTETNDPDWTSGVKLGRGAEPMESVEAILGVVSVGSAEPVTLEALEEALTPAEMTGLRPFINALMVEIGLAAPEGEPADPLAQAPSPSTATSTTSSAPSSPG